MEQTLKRINVVAAVIVEGGKVFATQRGYGRWKGWWEFPGGKVEKDENPVEALRREIREELASEVEVGQLLTTVEFDYPDFHLSMECYLCRLTAGELTLLEHDAARWLPPSEISSVKWLPADVGLLPTILKTLQPT